jgi:hypothetical protein
MRHFLSPRGAPWLFPETPQPSFKLQRSGIVGCTMHAGIGSSGLISETDKVGDKVMDKV